MSVSFPLVDTFEPVPVGCILYYLCQACVDERVLFPVE
jgi:hypothetical protein